MNVPPILIATITLGAPPVAIAAGVMAAACLLLLAQGRRGVRGTTLAAAWSWTVAAIVAAAAHAIWWNAGSYAASDVAAMESALRYAVAVLALCPTVAVLGAKRPQHHAWQAVVVAFAVVMFLPPVITLVLRGGSAVLLHPMQAAFLGVVTLMGAVNWLGTRYQAAGMGAAVAQGGLLLPFLGILPADEHASGDLTVCLTMLLIGLVFAGLKTSSSVDDPLARQWLDFRDRFGMFWSLRVMSRFNAAARAHDWPVLLRWWSVEPNPAGDEKLMPVAERSLRMLLRRFL